MIQIRSFDDEKPGYPSWNWMFNSFLRQYSIIRIITFFTLTNTGLCVINLCKNLTAHRTKSIEYENFEYAFNRALLVMQSESNQINDSNSFSNLFSKFDSPSRLSHRSVSEEPLLRTKTISLREKLTGFEPNLLKQVNTAIKCLNCSKTARIRVYYKPEGIELVGLLNKNNRVIQKLARYKGGFYNEQGVRLDVADRMLNPLRLVTPSTNKQARISSAYGYRMHPILKTRLFHAGIDIACAKNSKIHAALSGTIKKIGYSTSYGTYILVQHRGNLESFYAHLDSIYSKIAIGKRVSQGDIIGRVGRTGRSTAPHLHFETRIKGKHVNPKSIKPIHPKLSAAETRKIKETINKVMSEAA